MTRLRALVLVACAVLAAVTGAAAQSGIGVADVVERIKAYNGKVTQIPEKDYGAVLALLQVTRDAIYEQGAIDTFRARDDLAVIQTLVDMAALDDRGIRINASLILANVVDNTTLCALIDRLLTGNLNDNARYNLLQVTKVVAGYAREENRAWIEAVLDQTRSEIVGKADTEKTAALVDEIAQVLATSGPVDPVTFAQKYEDDYAACVALPRIEQIDLAPSAGDPPGLGGE